MTDIETQTHLLTWSQFVSRRKHELEDAEKQMWAALIYGRGFQHGIDRDLAPLVSTWNSVPFSFTIGSCSGTPKEHDRKTYEQFAGPIPTPEVPHAYLNAHSFQAHPLFERFLGYIQAYSKGIDTSPSGPHNREGFEGIFFHGLRVFVPPEITKKGDMNYLEKLWARLQSGIGLFLEDYHDSYNSVVRDFEWNLPPIEQTFVRLLDHVGKCVHITVLKEGRPQTLERELMQVDPYFGVSVTRGEPLLREDYSFLEQREYPQIPILSIRGWAQDVDGKRENLYPGECGTLDAAQKVIREHHTSYQKEQLVKKPGQELVATGA